MPILLVLLLPLALQAKSLSPVQGVYNYAEAPEFKAVLALIKSQGETELIT
jgi:hypothetical protein